MTKTRSRYASSVPRKRGHPSVVTTNTCEHAIDGSKPQCSSIRKTLFTKNVHAIINELNSQKIQN